LRKIMTIPSLVSQCSMQVSNSALSKLKWRLVTNMPIELYVHS
jgi:hypothetical protein